MSDPGTGQSTPTPSIGNGRSATADSSSNSPGTSSIPQTATSSALWARIRRHKIAEWSLAYVAFGYAALHGVVMLRETFDWPALVPRLTVSLLLLGFPVVVTLAWYHGHRARQRISGPELLIVSLLLLIAGSVLWGLSRPQERRVEVTSTSHPPPAPAIADRSIAVLPFADLSEKHDQEYFADGMAEEVIGLLARIPELKVIGRTSSFQFKGKNQDLRAMGSALGVNYVVEGSVRRVGDHVRVSAQLIDARDGMDRWSETYDRDAGDVLKVQGEIAANLVRALQLEVTEPIRIRAETPLANREVYDLYLRGMRSMDRIDLSGFEEAIADFRQALALDPSFVPAAEALARSLRGLVDWGLVPARPGWEQARAAALAALKLNPNSADAHAVLGRVYSDFDWDWPSAERELGTALALAPNSPLVLYVTAAERLSLGQYNEALRFVNAATAADPLDPTVHLVASWVYLRLGRLAEAESANRRMLEIAPTFVTGHYYLGIVLLMEGKAEEALSEMQKETPVGGRYAGLAVVYEALHKRKDAETALARLESESAGEMAMEIAEAYAFRGQKEPAFRWLDRALAQEDINLFYIKGDPLLKNLEGDSRYGKFLRKMNLSE